MTPDELLLLAEVCLDTLIASNNTDNHEVSATAIENIDDATTIELAVVTLHRIFAIWSQTPRLVENSTSVTRENDRLASAATSTTTNGTTCDTNLASARTTRSFNSARELIQKLRQSWILVGYTVVLATKTSTANVPSTTGNTQQHQHQQQQRQRALQVSSSRQGTSSTATELNLSTCAALHLGMGAQTQDRLFDYLRTQLRSLGSRGSGSSSGNGHGNTSTMIVSLPHRSSSWSCISEIQVALQVHPPSLFTPSPHPLNPPSEHTLRTHPYHTYSHHTTSSYPLNIFLS